jgi:nitrite reductase (cytochrome c-552)
VRTIQSRTDGLRDRAAQAMTDMLDAIKSAQTAGVSESSLKPVLDLQRKAMWRLDFISSENSHGFHADQEAMRVLAESIDYSRQAEIQALRQTASTGASLPTAAASEAVSPDTAKSGETGQPVPEASK